MHKKKPLFMASFFFVVNKIVCKENKQKSTRCQAAQKNNSMHLGAVFAVWQRICFRKGRTNLVCCNCRMMWCCSRCGNLKSTATKHPGDDCCQNCEVDMQAERAMETISTDLKCLRDFGKARTSSTEYEKKSLNLFL